jgi:mono/diheme cytochrome c family protein
MKFTFWGVFYLAVLFSACESPEAEMAREAEAAKNRNAGTTHTIPDGMAVFRKNCVLCHGVDGKLGSNGAKDLSASELPLDGRIQIITNGKNLMTPFKALLSEAEIKAVAEYSLTLKKQ